MTDPLRPTAAAAVIRMRGVRQNNLRGFDLDLPHGALICVTGVSGSGKSSLAFDTLYAEGQRRFVECLSSYARQFIERMDKPQVDEISGILPSVALRQGRTIRAARATVASLTELGERFRAVFAHAASPDCPNCGAPVRRAPVAALADQALEHWPNLRAAVTFELPVPSEVAARASLQALAQAGYQRAFHQGRAVDLAELLGTGQVGQSIEVLQDRLVLADAERSRLGDSLRQAQLRGGGVVRLWVETTDPALGGLWQSLAQQGGFGQFAASSTRRCIACSTAVADPSPQMFSSTSAVGACQTCNGFGRLAGIDFARVVPDPSLSLNKGAIRPWNTDATADEREELQAFCERTGVDRDLPWRELPPEVRELILQGEKGSRRAGKFAGVKGWFKWLESKNYKMHVRVLLARYRTYSPCPDCGGKRLRKEALAWKLGGLDLAAWQALPVSAVHHGLLDLQLGEQERLATELALRDLQRRVGLLEEIGLGYLSLDRSARTLSGGELQRVQLVAALTTGLSQVLYVLDEPSIGLHARDNDRLLRILERLKMAGNTVVVVEHDPALILAADVLVDLGPGAGELGGQLLGVGTPEEILALPGSLTADYLSGRKQVDTRAAPTPGKRAKALPHGWLTVRQPTARTLQGQDVQLQLGALNAVCGVSGSGKSTLVEEVLYRGLLRMRGEPVDEPGACAAIEGAEGLKAVVLVDQELPAASARANCATYLKVWDGVRSRLAAEPLAVQRGYGEATFSFNREGGRCPACLGLGVESVEMQFLSDVHMTCESCGGKRFRAEVLQVRHRGLDAAGFLERTAQEIAEQFSDDAGLANPMRALCELGLGYLRLGQPLSTLSGGEAQRLKIAWHLLQARTKGALFILDEPSTGLHLHDVAVLLANLRRLVAQGNTVLLVEHHLDLLAAADHVVELGPDGGPAGGRVLFQGPAEELLAADTPTATYLRQHRAKAEESAPTGLAYRRTPGLPPDHDAQLDPGCVQVRGARVHNLKEISLDVPRDRFAVVTGVSGSGKSSLAFDVIFAEGQRRFLDCLSPYARQYLPPALAPDVDHLGGLPPTVAIAQRTTRGGQKSTVATLTDLYPYLRLLYARCGDQRCPHCGGAVTGQSAGDVVAAIRQRYQGQPAVYLTAPAVRGRKGHHREVLEKARQLGHQWVHIDGSLCALAAVPELRRFAVHDLDYVVARIDRLALEDSAALALAVDAALALGDGTLGTRTHDQALVAWSLRRHCAKCQLSVEPPDPRLFAFTSAAGWCAACEGSGVLVAEKPAKGRPKKHEQDGKSAEDLAKAGLADGGEAPPEQAERRVQECPKCRGSRLRPEARSVTIGGLSIDQAAGQGPQQLGQWLSGLQFSKRDQAVVQPIAQELQARCAFLTQVGLEYLSLHRGAVTLSGGESQRLRLAAQLSSNLRGVLYVLDEPTIGLHPTDNQKVLQALEQLVARGNGLLVVEHDEDTIRRADHLIELGPSGGRQGGQVLYQGSLAGLLQQGDTPTGKAFALGQAERQRRPARPVPADHTFVELLGATRNNLRGIDVRFARSRFNAVTGVSGSGKSTLVRDLLVEYGNQGVSVTDRRLNNFAGNSELTELRGLQGLGRVVEIDQSPIGRTPRSCPATYMGVWDALRQAFAALPEAKVAGLQANQFSFNVEGGRCPTCLGGGALKVEMSFLPSTRVPCDTCGGKRFADHVLQVRYKGATVADVLAMSLAEAAEHFAAIRQIAGPLQLASRMGLDYLQLGQGSDTLSGGEAQRLKIVTELCKKRRVETLYILDEPTTGLHLQDVHKLLEVLHELVDRGDTLVVIEHQMDLVRQADWLVDMGPGPGEKGGQVMWQGTVAGFLAEERQGATWGVLG